MNTPSTPTPSTTDRPGIFELEQSRRLLQPEHATLVQMTSSCGEQLSDTGVLVVEIGLLVHGLCHLAAPTPVQVLCHLHEAQPKFHFVHVAGDS